MNFESLDEKMYKLKRKLEHLESEEYDIKVELECAAEMSPKKLKKQVEN